MPAIKDTCEHVIKDYISRAVTDVFKTMLGHDVGEGEVCGSTRVPWPGRGGAHDQNSSMVVGTVGFIGGLNGLLYLYFDSAFATACTGMLLGMTQVEVAQSGTEGVNDAVGELTNMVAGSFKNNLCNAGHTCKLTIPSILRGRNFFVEPTSSAHRYAYQFDCIGHKVVTDIIMNQDE
jgi:chemotaxis protein CheX